MNRKKRIRSISIALSTGAVSTGLVFGVLTASMSSNNYFLVSEETFNDTQKDITKMSMDISQSHSGMLLAQDNSNLMNPDSLYNAAQEMWNSIFNEFLEKEKIIGMGTVHVEDMNLLLTVGRHNIQPVGNEDGAFVVTLNPITYANFQRFVVKMESYTGKVYTVDFSNDNLSEFSVTPKLKFSTDSQGKKQWSFVGLTPNKQTSNFNTISGITGIIDESMNTLKEVANDINKKNKSFAPENPSLILNNAVNFYGAPDKFLDAYKVMQPFMDLFLSDVELEIPSNENIVVQKDSSGKVMFNLKTIARGTFDMDDAENYELPLSFVIKINNASDRRNGWGVTVDASSLFNAIPTIKWPSFSKWMHSMNGKEDQFKKAVSNIDFPKLISLFDMSKTSFKEIMNLLGIGDQIANLLDFDLTGAFGDMSLDKIMSLMGGYDILKDFNVNEILTSDMILGFIKDLGIEKTVNAFLSSNGLDFRFEVDKLIDGLSGTVFDWDQFDWNAAFRIIASLDGINIGDLFDLDTLIDLGRDNILPFLQILNSIGVNYTVLMTSLWDSFDLYNLQSGWWEQVNNAFHIEWLIAHELKDTGISFSLNKLMTGLENRGVKWNQMNPGSLGKIIDDVLLIDKNASSIGVGFNDMQDAANRILENVVNLFEGNINRDALFESITEALDLSNFNSSWILNQFELLDIDKTINAILDTQFVHWSTKRFFNRIGLTDNMLDYNQIDLFSVQKLMDYVLALDLDNAMNNPFDVLADVGDYFLNITNSLGISNNTMVSALLDALGIFDFYNLIPDAVVDFGLFKVYISMNSLFNLENFIDNDIDFSGVSFSGEKAAEGFRSINTTMEKFSQNDALGGVLYLIDKTPELLQNFGVHMNYEYINWILNIASTASRAFLLFYNMF